MRIDIIRVAHINGELVDLVQLRINRTWLHNVEHQPGSWPYSVYGRDYREALENLCKKIQGKTLVYNGGEGDLFIEVPFPLTYSV